MTATRLRRAITALAAVVAAGCVLTSTSSAAYAVVTNPSDTARQRAHALRLQLADLQAKAEVATEDYNTAQAALGAVVTQHVLAQEQLQNAQSTVDNADSIGASTVRALYRAGSPAALYATVFEGRDLNDVLTRIHTVQDMVSGQHLEAQRARAVVVGAASIEARLGRLAHQRTVLQKSVDAAMQRVQGMVAQQQALVASADAEVLRLQQAEVEAAAAAAAQNAATTLAAARAAAVPGGPGDVPPPNADVVALAIAAAQAEIGKPYRWGATGPDSFDCSGLTGWAYDQAGLSLPRTSRQQWYAGAHPGLGYLQPGDLLFWATDTANPASIHHVAIYIGNDEMIAAPHTGATVTVQPVFLDGFIGAVRPTHL